MRKRLFTKLCTLLLIVTMLTGSVCVYARALPCICGSNMTGQVTEYGSWRYTGRTTPCIHGKPNGLDRERKRTVTVFWSCGTCGYRIVKSTDTDYDWECNR